jgi:predicted site-specific integrase-resolvase
MVEDMISIITSFSARLYGQRGARKIRKQMKSLDATHVIGEEEEDEIRE